MFIQLSIKNFYPSITEDILENTITFAKTFISTTDLYLRITKHCRRSSLFSKEEVWKKKSTTSCFDITIESYYGAKICELVGVYILSHLETIISKNKNRTLSQRWITYFRGVNGQKTDEIRKNITEIF